MTLYILQHISKQQRRETLYHQYICPQIHLYRRDFGLGFRSHTLDSLQTHQTSESEL